MSKLLKLLTTSELQSVRAQCPTKPGTKVMVGLSGGVDSSFSAALLVALDLDVSGCWMKNWDMVEEDPLTVASCSQTKDLVDAQYVADFLKIPLSTRDFTKEYWCRVWEPSLELYRSGKTPNPDALCNQRIKFDCFTTSTPLGMMVATGHYARLTEGNNKKLCRALDRNKDQSHFLSTVQSFDRVCFPCGGFTKPRVKQLALDIGLDRIVKRPESQGVCFVGERGKKFSTFLENYLDNPTGWFICAQTGKRLPTRHDGILSYTVGQRARVPGLSQPLFVVRKENNHDIWVAPKHHPSLYVDYLLVRMTNLRMEDFPTTGRRDLTCQVRHRGRSLPCSFVEVLSPKEGLVRVELGETTRADNDDNDESIPEGQVLALFDNDEVCLGGGEIVLAHQPFFDFM